jgi:pSer/pThr/pTyr-binding forkhead associated (FHA) protein
MAITVRMYGAERPPLESSHEQNPEAPAIVFDAPRIIVGRAEGCEVRLPDTSVSHRHVSIRQRGADYVLIDEGSTNGTRVGRALASPHVPRVLGPREIVRVGRVWLELVIGHESPTKSAPQVAREIAIDLVTRTLAEEGEDLRPLVRCVAGPDAGEQIRIDGDRRVVFGRSRDADLSLSDEDASRRHVEIARRGDGLVVRDLGSKSGTTLGDRAVGSTDTAWRPGVELVVGQNAFEAELPVLEVLAEIERGQDERVPASELEIGFIDAEDDATESEADGDWGDAAQADSDSDADDAAPAEPPHATRAAADAAQKAEIVARRRSGLWSVTDFAVLLLALGVFSLSAVGYVVLLR